MSGHFRCVVDHERRFVFFGRKEEVWEQGTVDDFQGIIDKLNDEASICMSVWTVDPWMSGGCASMGAGKSHRAEVLTQVIGAIRAMPS
jgi:hypothetical protein